ncbi:MAG: glycosyltransferase family 4 protein, partial [Ignavibacteria bacterium]
EVVVFSGSQSKQKYFFEHYGASPVYSGSPVKQFFQFTVTIFYALIRSPRRSFNLFTAERRDGSTFSESVKNIYLNSHIINHKLDWLHFGFATMALKRENVAKAIGAKMGVSFRGYDINIFPSKNKNCYAKLWKNADKVHTISSYLYEKALRLGLSKNISYKKITPAIDIKLFKPKENSGMNGTPVKILTVGRLNWIKNYETAISVMKILKKSGIDFIYNIIGEGKELERLKFAVHQSYLNDRVFFLGKMEHKNITEQMRESDIYFQPSMQEGFGVAVLEAQATGLPCIVSDADGLKENIIDGKTGWIVSKRDPEAIAEKFREVLALSVDERRIIATNAAQRVEKEFNINNQIKKFTEFFSE